MSCIANWSFAVSLLCALALPCACTRVVDLPARGEGAYAARSTPEYAEDRHTFVHYDPELVGKLSIDHHAADRDENGRLVLQIEVRNRTSYAQAVDLQVAFKDNHGMDINDTTAWQRLTFEPNASLAHTVRSVDGRAAAYIVRFRAGS